MNPLTNDYEIPQTNFNYNFTTPASSLNGKVVMGQAACFNASPARLSVYDDFLGNGIYGFCQNQSGANNIGIRGEATNPFPFGGTSAVTIGVLGHMNGYSAASPDHYIGVAGFCGTPNYGLLPTTGAAIGVYGNSLSNFGGWAGYFDGDVTINGSQLPGPASPTPPGPYALQVNGNALTTAGAWYLSDKRFKENIKPLENVLEKIEKVSGYNYTFKTEEFKEKRFNTGKQIGFIAQELQKEFPELVKEDEKGYLAVNYQAMVPVLLEGMKEQQKQIDELKVMVQSLAGNSNPGNINSMAVNLSDRNTIVLNQNVPNPFAESTVITYNIPNDFSKAQIFFSTVDGRIIKTVDVTEKGEGRINVFANDLSSGLYTYTLVVDGKTIDTKKMVKQ